MKKIIRHVLYKTQCQFCGTEFAFEKSDVQWHSASDNKKIMPFTSCPCCGQETTAKADETTKIKLVPEPDYEEIQADKLQEKIDEYETAYQAFNLIKDKNAVMHIAKMQQQIDTFKAVLLHASERIINGNKCNLVYTEPLDDNDKHFINNIIRFIDEHEHENHAEPQEQEITVFDLFPQIKQSNAINIVVKTPIDDFTTDPEAELNEDDLNDIPNILAKNRKHGYVTVSPTNKDSLFRRTFIAPNLNEKGFLRQDRFATELATEDGFLKYMLFFPWSKINNQNAPYNEK